MKVITKRAPGPFAGFRVPAGTEMVIEPDWIATEMLKRDWVSEVKEKTPPKQKSKQKKKDE